MASPSQRAAAPVRSPIVLFLVGVLFGAFCGTMLTHLVDDTHYPVKIAPHSLVLAGAPVAVATPTISSATAAAVAVRPGATVGITSPSGSLQAPCAHCPYAWLEEIASHANDSYLLEHVLLNKLQEAACSPPAATPLERVLFVVMCSHDKQERVAWLHQSWLTWIPPHNVVLLSDQQLPGYNITLLPSLPRGAYLQAKFPNPSNYEAANLRHLKSVQWLGRVNKDALENIGWIFMVDDDSFVSPSMLLTLLRKIPASLPLLVGHKWDNQSWDPGLKGLAYPSGGAGILFTKVAFEQLAISLFEPRCDMRTFLNDVTIGLCTAPSKITKVHSLKFQPERTAANYKSVIQDAGAMISIHRVVKWQHALEYTCLVSKRFDWPHRCVATLPFHATQNATWKGGDNPCMPARTR